MTNTTLHTHDADAIATEFLGVLAQQDWAGVQSLLDQGVSFRVLTPRALREAADDADELTTLRSEVSMMHDRVGLSYRFRLHKDRWYVIEQRGYADVINGKITSLNL